MKKFFLTSFTIYCALFTVICLFSAAISFAQIGTGWVAQSAGTNAICSSVSFANANTGYAVGSGTVLRTNDGGASWTSCFTTSQWLNGVSCGDATHVTYVGFGGTIKHTTDGGNTWVGQTGNVGIHILEAVCFTDANTGTIVTDHAEILHTTDGGTTWAKQVSGLGSNTGLTGVSFTDANNGTIVSQTDTILHTTNGGITWVPQVPKK